MRTTPHFLLFAFGTARIRHQLPRHHTIMPDRVGLRSSQRLAAAERVTCESESCGGCHEHSHSPAKKGKDVAPRAVTPQQKDGQIQFVDRLAELKKIMDDNAQLVMLRQASPPKFTKALSAKSIAPTDLPAFEGLVPAMPGMVAEVMKSYLWVPYGLRSRKNALDEKEIDELVNHIDDLVQVFADIAQDSGFMDPDEDKIPFINVKLQVLESDGCRFWHQDCVPFRLCTTFRGPCTQWVYPAHATETLEQRQFDSDHAQSMSIGDVAIFKGRGDADATELYDQPGIVHRSPRIGGSGIYRLVLVIDIPQEGWHFDE